MEANEKSPKGTYLRNFWYVHSMMMIIILETLLEHLLYVRHTTCFMYTNTFNLCNPKKQMMSPPVYRMGK